MIFLNFDNHVDSNLFVLHIYRVLTPQLNSVKGSAQENISQRFSSIILKIHKEHTQKKTLTIAFLMQDSHFSCWAADRLKKCNIYVCLILL